MTLRTPLATIFSLQEPKNLALSQMGRKLMIFKKREKDKKAIL